VTPDDLMKRVAAVVREEADDPRLEAIEPLDEAAKTRIAENVASAIRARAARGARQKALWVAAPLALAASIALVVSRGLGGGDDIPRYTLAVSGDESPLRSRPDPSQGSEVRVRRDGRLRIVLQPETAAHGAIAARVFVARDREQAAGGAAETRPWPAAIEVSESGAVRVTATSDTLGTLAPGSWTVLVFVGRAAVVPADEAAARRAVDEGTPKGEQLARIPVTVVP